ncbi:protein of unknown function [Devosia crocina]|uniref:DUF4037 domain-containing protein n=1 Tax=Devosia crocina TaxID=429728 RepID=A0A1I7NPK1_9HYPH|nr:DUF4037 domain-containing protein [Devosia crocina]SFV36559.1 protein of unknown function [Devosia crocina]
MQGIELSRRFFTELVAPWLATVAPDLRYSAALMGYGSELLRFDDETSKDHNWGPRVHIHLTERDFVEYARPLVAAFEAIMPKTFAGEPIGWRQRPHPAADGPDAIGAISHGLEFHTLEGRLFAAIGLRDLEAMTLEHWLSIPEQKLLAFTAGAVFRDDGGRLTALRSRLAYFPDDVWYYRIASQWARIREQQAFVGRTGQVGDGLGSRVIAARLVQDVMTLAFLLERRYAPYPKWFGSGFAQLSIAPRLLPHLQAALAADHWEDRGEALAYGYRVLGEIQAEKSIAPFVPRLGPYFDRPFITINVDDAVSAAHGAISSSEIASLPVLGAIDQVSDLTPLLVDAERSRRTAAALLRSNP